MIHQTISRQSWLILTISFSFVRVSAPHYLPGVLPDLEGSPLGPLGLLLVEDRQDHAHLQGVEDAGPGPSPVQHPGGHDRSTAGDLLCTAIEAAAEPGSTHLQCMSVCWEGTLESVFFGWMFVSLRSI